MTSRNPFRPPTAPVADLHASPKAPRISTLLFGLAALVQLGLVARAMPFVAGLSKVGVLPPIGLLPWLAGLLCLYLGATWLVVMRSPARGVFGASVVLQSLAVFSWRGFMLGGFDLTSAILYQLPTAAGLAIAAWGAAAAGRRASAAPTLVAAEAP